MKPLLREHPFPPADVRYRDTIRGLPVPERLPTASAEAVDTVIEDPPDEAELMEIFDAISKSAQKQLETTPQAAKIRAAGLGHELASVVTQIAANAAYVVAAMRRP